jgi:uncharacterized protein YciI
MPYIIKAHDFPDALPRRMEVREKHLEALSGYKADGKVLYAAAMLNEREELAGSMLVVDMTLEDIQSMLLVEPYILHRVWDKDRLEIIPCKPAPGFGK